MFSLAIGERIPVISLCQLSRITLYSNLVRKRKKKKKKGFSSSSSVFFLRLIINPLLSIAPSLVHFLQYTRRYSQSIFLGCLHFSLHPSSHRLQPFFCHIRAHRWEIGQNYDGKNVLCSKVRRRMKYKNAEKK